jgi:hypothetical protein
MNKQKSIKAMRTFARDQKRQRGEADDTKPIPTPAPEPEKATTPQLTPPPKQTQQPLAPKKSTSTEAKSTSAPTEKLIDHIPSFHELQKTPTIHTDIKADEKPQPKTDTKKKGIQPKKAATGGTVITANKTERTPLLTEISHAVAEWFSTIKKSLVAKKKNTYTVSKTAHRKGVVQKATSKTGTIFSADNETLRKQIKARQRAEQKHADDEIIWSPYTEPGYPLLESQELTSGDPRIQKVSITNKTSTVPKTPPPVIKETEKIPELQEKPLDPPPAPTLVDQKMSTPPVPEPSVSTPTQAQQIIEESPTTPEPTTAKRQPLFSHLSFEDTNTLTILIMGLVIGIGLVIVLLSNLFTARDISPLPPAPPAAIYPTATFQPLLLATNDFNSLLQQIEQAFSEIDGQAVEFELTAPNQEVLNPVTILNILQTEPNDEFAKGIEFVRFLETATGDRAIILQATNHATAVGGMLDWEAALLLDVTPFFNLPDMPLSPGEFVDEQVNNTDIRALNYTDDQLLFYLVTNDETIVITDNLSVLDPYTSE